MTVCDVAGAAVLGGVVAGGVLAVVVLAVVVLARFGGPDDDLDAGRGVAGAAVEATRADGKVALGSPALEDCCAG